MALRHRQTGGVPANERQSLYLVFLGAVCIVVFNHFFWFPVVFRGFFGFPWELEKIVTMLGVFWYVGSSPVRVKPGTERAQLCFGKYTGISLRAGIHFQARLPFPFITFILWLFLKNDVFMYLGYTLEGEIEVKSIVVNLKASGMSRDSVRVSVTGRLVLEVENAATFLSQTSINTDRESLVQAIEAECSLRIKQRVIARHTVRELMTGEYNEGHERVDEWITEACAFILEYGLSLRKSPIVDIDIESDQIREVFDQLGAEKLLAANAVAAGTSFAEFQKTVPGVSEEVAMSLFSQARAAQTGVPRFNVHRIK